MTMHSMNLHLTYLLTCTVSPRLQHILPRLIKDTAELIAD